MLSQKFAYKWALSHATVPFIIDFSQLFLHTENKASAWDFVWPVFVWL